MKGAIEPSEHKSQAALISWAAKLEPRHPELALLYAIPNGAKLPARKRDDGSRLSLEAVKLIAEGMRSGMPDLCLPVARHGWHALYIEMKTRTGRISESQRERIPLLVNAGNCVLLARSWEFAAEYLLAYLQGTNGVKVWRLVNEPLVAVTVDRGRISYRRLGLVGQELELFDPYTWAPAQGPSS